jgi:hypothetical protein
MTNLHPTTELVASWDEAIGPDEAELAAITFLARYGGRTLDAYRHDLRNLFQWAADHTGSGSNVAREATLGGPRRRSCLVGT